MSSQDSPRNQFEQRMRLRRAATCVSAARVAIEGGRLLEAQKRLEEACALDPDGLEARILLEQLETAEPEESLEPILPPQQPVSRGAQRWSHWVAVAIAVAALAALVWWRAPSPDASRTGPGEQREQRDESRPQLPAIAEQEASPEPDPGVAAEADRLQAFERAPAPTETAGAARGQTAAASAEPSMRVGLRGTSGRAVPRPAVDAVSPAPPARREAAAAAAPLRSVPASGAPHAEAPRAAAANVPGPPAVEEIPPARAMLEETPAAAAPLEPPPLAARPDAAPALMSDAAAEEEAIGQVLNQYAEAYNRLDARAARQVWPSVDERALARAFANLESQGISFEACSLAVDGARATASCRGRARYVPKVGDRDPISQNRQWTFRLQRGGAGWQIVRAEAR